MKKVVDFFADLRYNIRMKVEKEVVMTLDSVNSELQILANEAIELRIDDEYEQFCEEMFLQFEMEQYERDCYDLDAEYYGAWK